MQPNPIKKLFRLIWAERAFWLVPLVLATVCTIGLVFYAQQQQLHPFIYPN